MERNKENSNKFAIIKRNGKFGPMAASSLLLAIVLAGPSLAADAVVEPEQPFVAPPVIEQPISTFSWSGAYLGLYGGHTWGNVDASAGALEFDADGFNGGLYGGYNFQTPGNWVWGVEGDAGLSAVDGSAGGVAADQRWNGALKGRVGYAFDNMLVYGSGGVAATKFKASDGTLSDSNTHVGWTAGLGSEYAITERVVTRFEYNYQDFGDKDYNLSAGSTPVEFDSHNLRLGLGLKF